MRGAPSAIEVAAFAWLIAPILLSWFLSRTGRYEGAHVLSSLALAGLIMAIAGTTGGIESFAAIWLVVVPLEAALSASRRVAAFASLLALSCAGDPDPCRPARLAAGRTRQRCATRRADGVRRRLRDALCRGPRLRRRVARAHQRRAAVARGGALSPARAQHERRHLAASAQRRGAVHLTGRGSHARHAGRATARPWPVRSRPCRRSSGLSHRALRCRARRRAQRRIPAAAGAGRFGAWPGRFHLGRDALPAARSGYGPP